MGLVIGTLVLTQASFASSIPSDKPDLMIPIFIRDYLPHGLIGILIVAILSAAMSSLSSAINSLSAATVEDFFNRDKQLSSERYLKISKLSAIFWGVLCIALAFFTGDIAKTVIEAINKVGSVFYGPILATFIAAVSIKSINGKGANIGILAGVAVNVYLWLFVPEVFWFWWNAVGAIVTLTVGLIASMILKDEQQSDSYSIPLFKAEWDKSKTAILLIFFVLIVCVSYYFDKLI